ncbi:AMP-binding enzyme, partial [Shewanella sp. 30m-9]
VLECAVVGVEDERSGEAVKAVIVLKQPPADIEAVKQAINDYCRSQLTAYKVPRIIEFTEQLPKSAVGKILRRELRK